MSVSSPAALPALLNERELEILRLLSAGHTVKSIAATLGRSEASINERLREARRKTGVGSSRELARQLATQKIWDEKIDLPAPDSPIHAPGQPPLQGHPWSKGRIVMLVALPAAAVGLLLTITSPTHLNEAQPVAASVPAAQSPLAGRWLLDVDRMPADERPRSVTISFSQLPDARWHTVVAIVRPDGAEMRAESTAAANGVPVPVTGTMPFIDTGSLRQPNPNTLVLTLGKDGQTVSTRVYAVASDGRTMTETIVWPGEGLPGLETNHFVRAN